MKCDFPWTFPKLDLIGQWLHEFLSAWQFQVDTWGWSPKERKLQSAGTKPGLLLQQWAQFFFHSSVYLSVKHGKCDKLFDLFLFSSLSSFPSSCSEAVQVWSFNRFLYLRARCTSYLRKPLNWCVQCELVFVFTVAFPLHIGGSKSNLKPVVTCEMCCWLICTSITC